MEQLMISRLGGTTQVPGVIEGGNLDLLAGLF